MMPHIVLSPAQSPAAQLVERLREARTNGQPFAPAWQTAWDRLEWSPLHSEALIERKVIQWAKPAFRDAYLHPERKPKWVDAILNPVVDGGEPNQLAA